MTNTYRDPHAGLRSQIASKRAATTDLARRVTPVRYALLGPEERDAIDDAATILQDSGLSTLSFDELVKLEQDLDALESKITIALSYTDVLLLTPGVEVPTFEARPEVTEPPAKWVLDARAIYADIIEEDAIERLGNEGWTALFEDEGAFLFGCEAFATDRNEILELDRIACVLACSWPAQIPSFVISPVQGDIADYRGRLGLKKNAAKRMHFADVCRFGGAAGMADALFPRSSKTRELYLELDTLGALEPPTQRKHPFLIAGNGELQVGWVHDARADAEELFDIALTLLKTLRKEAMR